ncbi:MAG TPA: M14 family zinc carboxypeptidase [Gemmatimonadaceae bacterium]|nr:M14 family zinc carboxypeptidase [Gemmatimonadaceae bacterium]
MTGEPTPRDASPLATFFPSRHLRDFSLSRRSLSMQRILRRVSVIVGVFAATALTARTVHAQKTIPSPESVFGFPIGKDSNLVDYEQSIDYFKKLAAASNRIHLMNVGVTSFGRPWTVAIITSPENYAKLDHYRQINMRLAHPAGLTDSAAHALARQGKVIVDISGGLHASEIAGSQHTPQLAYEILAHANEPRYKEILDNVIFFLWPTINPDGQDIVVKNCRETMFGRPPLNNDPYEKYMGHDNNRDSYMMNGIESRVRQRVWREWEPDIIYVHHQSSPQPTRIWIPPFADPVGYRAPPIPAREINTIGMLIAQELDAHEQIGAAHALATFDAYYPGYIDYMPVYQNIPSWWTETQGGNCATTQVRTKAQLPKDYQDIRPTALYLSPWVEGSWSLRDAVNVMVTASIATLRYGAKFGEDVLYNRYQSGRDVIKKYGTQGPFAYIVPQDQHDPVAPVELLRRFAFHGIRMDQLDKDVSYDGVTYPKGTWVIPMDQEYASLVQEVFEVQHYPDMGDDTPYDAAGWTLPFQMGVNVIEADKPLSPDFRSALKPVPPGKVVDWHTAPDAPLTTNAEAAGIVPRPGKLTGTGDAILLDPAQNNAFKFIAKALADGGKIAFEPGASGRSRYVVTGVSAAKADAWASELWVTGERTSGASGLATAGSPPRIGLGNDGWTQWLLDTYGIKYTNVTAADLQSGNLASRFDVLVLPGGLGGRGFGGGGGRGGRGGRGGGVAAAGADEATHAVDEFVRGGGTVLSWANGASGIVQALQLPVRSVVAGLSRKDYFTGTSLFAVTVDAAQPVMAGMPDSAVVTVSQPPSFTTTDGFEGEVLAKFPAQGSPLRSGFLSAGAEKYFQGYAAALDVKHGSGHVVLLAFTPNWRGQPTATFRTILNSLFFGKDVAAQAKATAGFWTPPAK